MSKRVSVVLVAALALCLGVLLAPWLRPRAADAPNPAREVYQYTAISKDESSLGRLNELGEEGWIPLNLRGTKGPDTPVQATSGDGNVLILRRVKDRRVKKRLDK